MSDHVYPPEWQRQSVDRSLHAARMRAQDRCDRFVDAATDLLKKTGNTDFTVQEVVDRSRMSIRTFYNLFASKDDLLVAVHERVLARDVVPHLRRRCDEVDGPLARIRAYIEGLFELTSRPGPGYRTLTAFHNRLAETRPSDLEHSLRPLLDLICQLVDDAETAGVLRTTVSTKRTALLLHQTVLSAVRARVFGSDEMFESDPDDLWSFCAFGIGIEPTDAM